jgi:hypothetical protein
MDLINETMFVINGFIKSLNNPISQFSPIWLLLSALISLIFGLISSYAFYRLIKEKEIRDMVTAEYYKLEEKARLDESIAQKERTRQEIIRWANPILDAGFDLNARLKNILNNDGYLALNKDFKNPNWSISYDYFMMSTLYLFSQYFCWIRMLQEEFNFELFQSQEEKSSFFIKINDVSRTLGGFPPNYGPNDMQVFRMQQRALGELMIERENGKTRCLAYPEFILKMDNPEFSKYFNPLVALLDNLESNDGRWNRLSATKDSLTELIIFCENVFNLKMESYYGKSG